MGRDKDKHGKGRNDDWEREKESIDTYAQECARGLHRWGEIAPRLLQCHACGAVKGS